MTIAGRVAYAVLGFIVGSGVFAAFDSLTDNTMENLLRIQIGLMEMRLSMTESSEYFYKREFYACMERTMPTDPPPRIATSGRTVPRSDYCHSCGEPMLYRTSTPTGPVVAMFCQKWDCAAFLEEYRP